jgi:CDGSH-type Zn-finger protein
MSNVTVRVRDNGPLLVEGPITLVDAEGHQFAIPEGKPAIALCRCGHSERKPFCDGAHKGKFDSCVRAAGLDSK